MSGLTDASVSNPFNQPSTHPRIHCIEAAADADNGLQLIGVPNRGWRNFFGYVVAQRETGDSRRRVEHGGSVRIAYRLAV